MRLAIIFILLIVVTGTQAQRAPFLGRVLDTEAKPIASEHVNFPPNFMRLLNNLPADRLAHAIADKQGRFRLPCHPTDPQSMGTLVAFHPQNGSSAVRLEEALPRVVRLRPLREFHGPETDSEENPVSGARLRWHMGFNEQNDTGLFLPSVEPFCVYTVQQGRIFLPLDPTFTRVHITYKAHGYAPLVHHLTKPDWEKLSREGLQFRLDTVIQLFAKLVYPHIGEPMPNMPVVLADMHLAYSDQAGNPSASVPTQGTLLRPGWNEDSPTHMHQGIYPSVRMGSQQIEGAHDFGVIEDYTQPKVKFVVQNKPMPYASIVSQPPLCNRAHRQNTSLRKRMSPYTKG